MFAIMKILIGILKPISIIILDGIIYFFLDYNMTEFYFKILLVYSNIKL